MAVPHGTCVLVLQLLLMAVADCLSKSFRCFVMSFITLLCFSYLLPAHHDELAALLLVS